ncbi:uncharacterized protein SAPINGB_P005962 [Magnusiomyces paraingens]|uniref:Fungal lipase-type domain-containing protein n=1 Tax=Magnusiomyces paraingens TaxID=2606893 RepID=A0A5E8C4J0_9ASCO|nr:uncharacterized protein SAPINGB_P005962 [Saprochaete ingens]VVT57950.1 unnamed protein product [Saprochaete ingens]
MSFLFKKINPFARKPPETSSGEDFHDSQQLDSKGCARDDPLSEDPDPNASASPSSPHDHRKSSVAQEFSLSDNPTPLIPERFARIVSTLSRGSTITLRLGTYLVSSFLDSARIGTLTSLSVTSGAIENLLLRAQHDANVASSHPESSDDLSTSISNSPAALITSNSLNMVNRAATLAQLFTAASFHLASTSLQTASGMAQDTLHILDAIFGSTESSRALAAIISLIRREFGDGSGIYSLVTGLTCFSILQSRGWSRTVDEIEMFILWDVVVLDTGETLSQQFPSTLQEPKKTDEDSILAAIPPNAQYKVAIDEVKTKTYNIDVQIPANSSAAADAGSSIHIQLPKGATVLHQEFVPAEKEGEGSKYNITFQTTSNYFRERKGTLSKEDDSQNTETNGKQHDSGNGLSLSSLAGISNLSQVAGNGSVTAAQFIPDPTAVSIKTRPPSPSLPDNYDDEPPSCINDRRYSFNNPLILENIYNEMQSDDDDDDDDNISIDDDLTSDEYSENGNEGSLLNGNHPNSDSSLSSTTFVDKPIKHTQSFPEYPELPLHNHHHSLSRRNTLKSSSSSSSINSNKDQLYPGNINRRSLTRLSSMTRLSNLTPSASSGQLAGRSNSQVSLCTSCPKGRQATNNNSSAASIRSCSVDPIRGPITASDPLFIEPEHSQQQHTMKRFPPGHITANMAKYMRFATASYGQSFMYVLGMGKYASNYTGDPSHHSEHYAFAHHTGLDLDDIVLSSYSDSAVNDSAGIPLVHFVALDHAAKAVVLTIRGTLGIEDILTDLTCDYETMVWQGTEWKAHGGMLRCAQVLKRRTSRVLTTIKQALETWGPEYGLVICGHSLGGGVGAILGILLSEQNEQGVFVTAPGTSLPAGRRVQCFAYGPPGSISEDLRKKTRVLVTTVVYGLDIVPCLSLGVLRDFQSVALAFKNDRDGVAHDIRKRFLAQFASRHSHLVVHDADDDYLWNLLKRLRGVMQSEKLVPPGEVYHISTNTVFETHDGKTKRATRIIGKVIVDVQKRFGEPVFGRGIFHHSPVYYERALQTLKMGVCNAPV